MINGVSVQYLDGACLGEAGATRDPGRVDGVGHGVEAALHGHPADQPGGVVVVDLEATNQVVEVLVDNLQAHEKKRGPNREETPIRMRQARKQGSDGRLDKRTHRLGQKRLRNPASRPHF